MHKRQRDRVGYLGIGSVDYAIANPPCVIIFLLWRSHPANAIAPFWILERDRFGQRCKGAISFQEG
ncbi:MAG: hypothetical protein AAGD25_02945 [Cyanobacteria bacterium P01_F01_bin.150]